MRIGIESHAAEQDGSGNCTYIRNYLRALKRIDADHRYILYVTDLDHPFFRDFEGGERFSIKVLPVKNPLWRIPVFLSQATFRDRLELLHVQWHAPPWHRGKLVSTIHDLGFLHHPETFSRFDRIRARIVVGRTARQSDWIITGSEFSKRDLIDRYGLVPDKIAVVPYGISPVFRREDDERRIHAVLEKYGITGKYILSVGRLNPRKNLVSLAGAFSRFKSRHRYPHKLVIAGKTDYRSDEIIRSIRKSKVREDIVFTGFVGEDDLPVLFGGADVFVYPSLFEGVGLPVLEAMSCGTPVVASDSSSLREMVGDAGLLVDPLDVEGIADAILSVVEDEGLREDLIGRGTSRAKDFTWEKTARETLAVYGRLDGLEC